ncbi:MAG: hypothetical protein U0587_14985 [Candidatus Binatia bacterium]
MRTPRRQFTLHSLALAGLVCMAGCTAMKPMPKPDEVMAPTPIAGNGGAYVSPYKRDGSLAPWADQSFGAAAGKMAKQAGTEVGMNVTTNVGAAVAGSMIPGIGGLFAKAATEEAGKSVKASAQHGIAVSSRGGMEQIKATSDLSFNTVDDLAVYLYATHSHDDNYQTALDAAMEVYPDLQKTYESALKNAPRVSN